MSSGVEEVADHLANCAKVDAAIVMQEGSADDMIETLLAQGWTWGERPTEYVAGKRIRYLRSPGE